MSTQAEQAVEYAQGYASGQDAGKQQGAKAERKRIWDAVQALESWQGAVWKSKVIKIVEGRD